MLVVGNDPQFARLVQAMGVPELVTDERFVTNEVRIHNRAGLNEVLVPIFLGRPKQHWIEALGGLGVPCGPVNEVHEVFADPQVRQREMVVEMAHPQRDAMPLLANPIKFSETPVQYRLRPPALGEHTAEVLSALAGIGSQRLAELRAQGVIWIQRQSGAGRYIASFPPSTGSVTPLT